MAVLVLINRTDEPVHVSGVEDTADTADTADTDDTDATASTSPAAGSPC